MKNILLNLFLVALIIAANSILYAADKDKNIPVLSDFKIAADSIAPDPTGMRDLTSLEISKLMIPGWNVGNSLDAIGGETNWGNPRISQKLIDSVKAAGFNSVRVPVAWSKFTDEENFVIDPDWLVRVEEVVNYILGNDMYAIINIHWDGGWMQPTYAEEEYVNNRLSIMWEQIAIHFRDYNDHLLFAGTNEVMKDGDYGTPKTEYYTVQNGYNQTFVNTVRSTGGRNHYRHLLVQGFNTNIDHTNNFFVMPDDVIDNRLTVEVHYYDPYDFTINTDSNVLQWGNSAPNSQSWANESWVDGQFNKMKTKFIDHGIGVVVGEYGVIHRLDLGSDALEKFEGYRTYYMEYVSNSIVNNGLVPIVWDNGGTGNHGMGLFNRHTGGQAYPHIIKAVIDAKDTTTTDIGMNDDDQLPSSFSLGQNYPNPFNPSTKITFSLSQPGYVKLSVFDTLGREIGILLNEEKSTGNYSVIFNAIELSSGIYYYKINVDDFSQTKKMLLLR